MFKVERQARYKGDYQKKVVKEWEYSSQSSMERCDEF
jgi:hypothetical protein